MCKIHYLIFTLDNYLKVQLIVLNVLNDVLNKHLKQNLLAKGKCLINDI